MSVFTNMVNSIESWFNTSPVGKMIEDDVKLAIKELESVGIQDLENIVKVVGVTVLQSLVTTGGNTPAAVAAAIEAGISAAVPAFKAAGTDITTKTVTTLVGTVVNQLGAVAPSVAAQKVATPSA